MVAHNSLSMILESPNGQPIEELADSLEAELADLSEAERFGFDQALKTIGSTAQTALPGAAQGAATGAALGPWGALIGGAAGAASSIVSSAQAKPRQTAGRPMAPRPLAAAAPPAPSSSATTPPGAAVATPPAPGDSGHAAAQLLSVIQNPSTLQALAALVAGPLGKQQVPAGDTTAPPASFLNLMAALASQALTDADALEMESTDSYLRDGDGEYAWDAANPEARARALMTHLQRAPASRQALGASQSAGDWLLQSGLAEIIDPSII